MMNWNVWNLAIGPAGFLLGLLITLYIKESSRDTAKREFAESINSSLATFKTELLDSLDDRFVRQGECALHEGNNSRQFVQIENRLNSHDQRILVLEQAHSTK